MVGGGWCAVVCGGGVISASPRVRQLAMGFGTISHAFLSPAPPPHAPCHTLRSADAYSVLICACNSMVCPDSIPIGIEAPGVRRDRQR